MVRSVFTDTRVGNDGTTITTGGVSAVFGEVAIGHKGQQVRQHRRIIDHPVSIGHRAIDGDP